MLLNSTPPPHRKTKVKDKDPGASPGNRYYCLHFPCLSPSNKHEDFKCLLHDGWFRNSLHLFLSLSSTEPSAENSPEYLKAKVCEIWSLVPW